MSLASDASGRGALIAPVFYRDVQQDITRHSPSSFGACLDLACKRGSATHHLACPSLRPPILLAKRSWGLRWAAGVLHQETNPSLILNTPILLRRLQHVGALM